MNFSIDATPPHRLASESFDATGSRFLRPCSVIEITSLRPWVRPCELVCPRLFRAGVDWWIHGGSLYAKVFTQIFDSSIADNYKLRQFFVDMLVLADINGVVDMTPAAIAGRTRIPLEEVKAHLAELETPDPESRTPDHDGRRIARLDEHRTWGWLIINYHKFRAIASEDQRREKTKTRTQKWRKSQQMATSDVAVTLGDAGDAMQREREMEMEKEVLSGKPDGVEISKAPKEKERGHYHKDARSVLHLLNETCGRQFREVDANLSVISCRLREPDVSFEGVSLMIARQCQRWMNTSQAEYLRPETLFGKTKFDGYYAAREQPVILSDNPKTAADQQAKVDFVKALFK